MAVLAVRDRVLFPQMVTPLPVGRPRSLRAIEYALGHEQAVLIVAQRDAEQDEVGPADLYSVGTEAVIGGCSSCRMATPASSSRASAE